MMVPVGEMTTSTRFALVFVGALFLLLVFKQGCQPLLGAFHSEEGKLIGTINDADDPELRTRLIDELEEMPVEYLNFANRWLAIHAVRSPGAWDDEGFDHRRTNTPRDIEILTGVLYGVSDIENGGLHQFFINGTGGMAPEMVEFFKRYDLEEAAEKLKQAMAVFGEEYPRSQEARNRFLEQFEGTTRQEFAPFHEMDGPFFEALLKGVQSMDDHADRVVREVWGITSLHTELPPVDWQPSLFSEKSR